VLSKINCATDHALFQQVDHTRKAKHSYPQPYPGWAACYFPPFTPPGGLSTRNMHTCPLRMSYDV